MTSEQARRLLYRKLPELKIQLQNTEACIAALEKVDRVLRGRDARRRWHEHSNERAPVKST
jgi:hypothetical protein